MNKCPADYQYFDDNIIRKEKICVSQIPNQLEYFTVQDEHGAVIYEGNYKINPSLYEYLKTGSGIEWRNFDNKIKKYQGEFKDNLYDGHGTEFDDSGNEIYDGWFKEGKRDGKGKEISLGKMFFDGIFHDGQRNGNGEEYENGSVIYNGMFKDGKRDGKGKLYENGSLVYDGEFKEGKWVGPGKNYISGELVYDGTFNNEQYAKGKQYAFNVINHTRKLVYDGEFKDGKWNGLGIHYVFDTNKNVSRFEGTYIDFKRNGQGKDFYNNILQFEGEFKDGKKNGIGSAYYYNNNRKFVGEYKDGKKNGNGKEYLLNVPENSKNNHYVSDGNYKNDMKNGLMKEFDLDGNSEFYGTYKNDIRDGPCFINIRGKMLKSLYANGQIIIDVLNADKGDEEYKKNNNASEEPKTGKLNKSHRLKKQKASKQRKLKKLSKNKKRHATRISKQIKLKK